MIEAHKKLDGVLGAIANLWYEHVVEVRLDGGRSDGRHWVRREDGRERRKRKTEKKIEVNRDSDAERKRGWEGRGFCIVFFYLGFFGVFVGLH